MKILLDTYVLIALLHRRLQETYPQIENHLNQPVVQSFVSISSLWEIATKSRLGKLDPKMPLDKIGPFAMQFGLNLLPITEAHVIANVDPIPSTRDPFDRLLLAQCQVEGLLLATADRALVSHALALKT